MSPALTALAVLLLTTAVFAKDVNWPAGHLYTSRTKLFTLTMREGGVFQVQEEAKKGDNAYEEVKLLKRGYGGLYTEAYMVGVRRIGRDVLSIVQQPKGDLPPPALAYIALFLHFGGRIPGPPKPINLEETTWTHGPGVLAMNEVENGSLIAVTTLTGDKLQEFARGRVPPTRRPTYVASAAVRNGEYLIYASAQNDYFRAAPGTPAPDEGPEWDAQWQASLAAAVRDLLSSVAFSRPLDARTFR